MSEIFLLHDILSCQVLKTPDLTAITQSDKHWTYREVLNRSQCFANAIRNLGVKRGDRVAILLSKSFDIVAAMFGISIIGAIFVPINPKLKSEQISHILNDCTAKILISSFLRWSLISDSCDSNKSLSHVVCVDLNISHSHKKSKIPIEGMQMFFDTIGLNENICGFCDTDPVALLYTSGSTGKPKGVIISHRNFVIGAKSVVSYLGHGPEDVILALLPFSFDAGFSQITTAFLVGARLVFADFIDANEIVRLVDREKITHITAVPPIWISLAEVSWKSLNGFKLKSIANTGGKLPLVTLDRLRAVLPDIKIFLMYGLTEAFRSTYLPPEEIDLRPDSIGKAIPNAEILVLRPDGSKCEPGEQGELVHRGALVSLGYWNDPVKTAERFRPITIRNEMPFQEIAVFSGDLVKLDDEGFLYFVGRSDMLIKVSGYRVSSEEVEEMLYQAPGVKEAAVFGEFNLKLGQSIVALLFAERGKLSDDLCGLEIIEYCRKKLPHYMVPERIVFFDDELPRNPNGKIDRAKLSQIVADHRSATAGKNIESFLN